MPPVPKPTSKPKEEKKYSSLQQKTPLKAKPKNYKGTKAKKSKKDNKGDPLNELKKEITAQHNRKPTRKDRAEFPPDVVQKLKEEADGRCMCGCGRPDTETHHVMPRTRDGRGVKTNGMRVTAICNQRFHANEEELQYWIEVYREKYGEYFWYDDRDWEEHRKKEEQRKIREQKEKELLDSYKPIAQIIESNLGRKPTSEETGLLRRLANSEKDMETLVGLIEELHAS